ncbi:hypothetical protein BC937DRAFT_95430 [Endogone sp. FLAS-F59071]|nr:hypothetical protein BC937DRAFT_95430 [Endogone sp. FLAS-F59071]|eukprot:RUS13367.1 hypothetical protein BC937DRAFT_95430 [Endogone sp. FLAS-F59071]
MVATKPKGWSVREKLLIVHFAEQTSNHRAAQKFNIQTKQVQDYRNKKAQFMLVRPWQKRLGSSRPAKWPLLEEKLVQYVQAQCAQGHAVPTILLTLQAAKFAKLPEL